MTDETQLRLPAPPAEYNDAEREAFYEGARQYVQALGSQHDLILAALDQGPADDQETDADTDARTDGTACPECNAAETTSAFGTTRCADCGAVLD